MPRCSGVKQQVTVTSKSRSASIWRSNHSRAPGRKRPGKPGAKMADAKAFHPGDGLVQAVIFKMEPLAESHVGRVTGVNFGRRLRAVVFAQQANQQLGRALKSPGLNLLGAEG